MPEIIVSPKLYYKVFAALIVLALATTGIAFVDLGKFNTVVALIIAATKAVLIVLVFMHVRYEGLMTFVFVIAGFCWLAIMMALMYGDYFSRTWLPAPGALPSLRF